MYQVKVWREKLTTEENQGSFLNQELKIKEFNMRSNPSGGESDQRHEAKRLKIKHTKGHIMSSGIRTHPGV